MKSLRMATVTTNSQYRSSLTLSSDRWQMQKRIIIIIIANKLLYLRSVAAGLYDVPRTRTLIGSRAFSVAGPSYPKAWNSLPQSLRDMTSQQHSRVGTVSSVCVVCAYVTKFHCTDWNFVSTPPTDLLLWVGNDVITPVNVLSRVYTRYIFLYSRIRVCIPDEQLVSVYMSTDTRNKEFVASVGRFSDCVACETYIHFTSQ